MITRVFNARKMESLEVSPQPNKESSHQAPAQVVTRVKKASTAQDVAERAGVARPTVSAVLNGARTNSAVSPATRERILQAAQELGYRANPVAQRLAAGRANNTIAIYSPALDPGITVAKMQHIQLLLNRRKFQVQLHAHPFEDLATNERHHLLRALRHEKPRGILCNAGWHFGQGEIDELRGYQAEGGVVVCMGYGKPNELDCDQVIFDERCGIRLALEHLKQLGHHKIGVSNHDLLDLSSSAQQNFVETASALNLEVNDAWLLGKMWAYYEDLGMEVAQQFLALKERPTAMVIGNDAAAAAFVHSLYRHDWRVPRDLSVVGIDDMSSARACVVPLTATTQPYRLQGERAVEMLLERLDGLYAGPRRIELLHGELVVRESTAPHNCLV